MAHFFIVDDRPETAEIFTRLIEHMGHETSCTFAGAKAVELLTAEHLSLPDVVILDAMMPEMDGLEVLRRLRQHPRTIALPVVIFSANNDQEFQQQFFALGIDDYWVKAQSGMFDRIFATLDCYAEISGMKSCAG